MISIVLNSTILKNRGNEKKEKNTMSKKHDDCMRGNQMHSDDNQHVYDELNENYLPRTGGSPLTLCDTHEKICINTTKY